MQRSSGSHHDVTVSTPDGVVRVADGGVAVAPRGRTIDVQRISSDLIVRFGAVLTVEAIERCVTAAAAGFADARIDAYLPVLVHSAARRELERVAKETTWTAMR